jgi:hypothetical protein
MKIVANDADLLQFIGRVDELRIGDLIMTPAHLWETVIALGSGNRFTRSTRVDTNETGLDHPREWANHHRLIVQRRKLAAPVFRLVTGPDTVRPLPASDILPAAA